MTLTKSNGGAVFRKIAMGSWKTAADPSVYGLLELDVSNVLIYLEKLNKESEVKIGISEFVGRVTALVLIKRPEMNGIIRLGRIYLRKHVNLFYQVNVPGGEADPIGKANLLGLTIDNAETKSLSSIAKELKLKAGQIKKGHESELTKSVKTLSFVPWQFMRYVLNLTSFLNYDLNLPLQMLGMPKDPFGSVMITNVGSMGVETAWAPLVPYTRVPLLLTVGAVVDRPWVVSGKIEARPIIRIGCTFDHRFMDGVHAAAMNRLFIKYFENPVLTEEGL
jgi:pyruvate/2-oxoglutarate dehydrogenase complex dihydrolipoamide acyltransferase (E2) component